MPAAARKKRIIEEPVAGPVIADDRLALHDAIERRKKANDAVTRQHEAIYRARSVISEAEEDIEKRRAKVATADETDARRAASLIKSERPIVSGWVGENARHAVEHGVRNAEMARRARAKLQDELAELELAAKLAENAVLVERNRLIAPVAALTVAKLENLRSEMASATALLDVLMRDQAPQFSDRDLLASMKCAAARQAVLADVRPFVVNGNATEIFEMQKSVRAEWTRKLAALLADATAEL